jgi:hypothetical protein
VKVFTALLLASTTLLLVPAGAANATETPVVLALATATAVDPVIPRDNIGIADHIRTGERTFARLFLGGRVLVLARDSAVLRIIEVPGAATIWVERGRVAITVDRENLHPEDLIEVRTPHAVVSVADETLVVEATDAASTFTALGSKVDVFALDPATGDVAGTPTSLASNEAVTVARVPTPATDVAAADAPLEPRR